MFSHINYNIMFSVYSMYFVHSFGCTLPDEIGRLVPLVRQNVIHR